MPQNSSKALFVLDILRRETDVEHRLSAPALLKRLEEHGIRSERRSIYRAVDALRAHGERIEKTPTGYYYAREAPDKNDLYALTAAVQTAGFLSDARKQALFRALGALWGARAAEETISCGAAIVAASARNDAPFMAMLTASQAIAAGKQLTFSASLPEPGGCARLRVNPYALFFKGGACRESHAGSGALAFLSSQWPSPKHILIDFVWGMHPCACTPFRRCKMQARKARSSGTGYKKAKICPMLDSMRELAYAYIAVISAKPHMRLCLCVLCMERIQNGGKTI